MHVICVIITRKGGIVKTFQENKRIFHQTFASLRAFPFFCGFARKNVKIYTKTCIFTIEIVDLIRAVCYHYRNKSKTQK